MGMAQDTCLSFIHNEGRIRVERTADIDQYLIYIDLTFILDYNETIKWSFNGYSVCYGAFVLI